MMQRTIQRAVEVAGIGLHLGEKARLVLQPAPVNTGVVFRDANSPASRTVAAIYSNVKADTVGFCTRLRNLESGFEVATVEHVLAAIHAAEITNIHVDVSGPEIPILDGSSAGFLDALERAGVDEQGSPQSVLTILRPVQVVQADKAAYLLPRPTSELTISVEVDFPGRLPRQWTHLDLSEFGRRVASARTFTFRQDIDRLHAMGLAKGGSLSNAVVFDERGVPLNPDGLRFPDEWSRHKALDVVGDLALAGLPIHGHYVGIRPGHALTHELLHALFADHDNFSITTTKPDVP
ncbi:UDP-3-O-[3-hydroxymyristoyl] N-acetylglucosamine deacetylase [Aphanomyces invadans]|uniref:UDP-3-O-acyl-N-acetylglucosamine deacetylase n=1 Tax=Aphanomyces invadans TaxID=157072 RepID=A0A024TJJ8_9STRA|nr:UDP-3-O-[3-hydroxymyristoyl] N-acetylglucosamine deacetylase [Aphanomyces invadans]ETV94315.1 UDP-3-O-[3-hydroxymyristoyl] N-acetylglucosamine deacetylase [Aphanomyces invadans]|eukprot:XP_008877077.1 UDP-3-O-[3-hydroxymyristoyl] N-acetylglucosamine deacetylase [Aphanomyces invadans]